jgi:two-component system, sensor histidine kinase
MRRIDHERVLVLAPTAGDASITQSILDEVHIANVLSRDVAELCATMREGVGAILVTDDVLLRDDVGDLVQELRSQPTWSDVPVLLLGRSRAGEMLLGHAARLGNLTILERPVRLAHLISALQTAIRARRRQYQLRDQLVALELAEGQLRESDRRKDEFLAILAHELRNPLAPARNAAYFMKLEGPNEPHIRRAVEMIERQVELMARLIDDLLDVSRISRGILELRRERIDFHAVVAAALETCRQDTRAKRHTLHVALPKTPVVLEADRERMIQVLCNLLTNAIKYTPSGGRIELSAEQVGEQLEITIRDNGIGIPTEKLSEIFELFAQVDRSLERQGGLGIGLTLVRQIVELHGGKVEAHSDGIGRGSAFLVRLPVARALAAEAAPEPVVDPPIQVPKRILAADDNRDAAESLAALLELEGHEVRTAFDGEAAIESLRTFVPDVALLDIGMPKRNGFDVARHIRAQPWGGDCYLVAVTGWGQERDRARAREAGFDAHLVKPVEPAVLMRLLANGVRSAKDGVAKD